MTNCVVHSNYITETVLMCIPTVILSHDETTTWALSAVKMVLQNGKSLPRCCTGAAAPGKLSRQCL